MENGQNYSQNYLYNTNKFLSVYSLVKVAAWQSSNIGCFFSYGIYPVEGIGVFRVPKNGDARNKKPPALRVETKRCTKKSPFRYNRVVQALL